MLNKLIFVFRTYLVSVKKRNATNLKKEMKQENDVIKLLATTSMSKN